MFQLLICLGLGLAAVAAGVFDFYFNFLERYCALPFWAAAILPLVFLCSFVEHQRGSSNPWFFGAEDAPSPKNWECDLGRGRNHKFRQ